MVTKTNFTGKLTKLLDKRSRGQTTTSVYRESTDSFSATSLQIKRQDFTSATTIVVIHNFGVLPFVQLAFDNGDGTWDSDKHILYNILHDSVNQFTITLSIAGTGQVVCLG